MRQLVTPRSGAGFTLVEMIVATVMMIIVMAGVAGLYVAHRNARVAEDLSQTVEAQLRLGMDTILFKLRNAGYGAGWGTPALWVTWVSPSFTGNPMITQGTGSAPDTLSVASCTSRPVAWLAADAAAGATSLVLDSAAGLDSSTRSVILINDSESAKITSISGNTINIETRPDETDPPEPDGVLTSYRTDTPATKGTPICRVDIVTYSVDTAAATLREDLNQGAGPQVIVDGITDLQVATDTTGVRPKFQITLTARASAWDPFTTTVAQRSLTSLATARN